mgnify:CR=1 FL=1
MIMKIVFLDRKTIGEDIDLTDFETLGEVVTYEMSQPEEVPERVVDADVIIVNKVPVNEQTIGTAQNLKLVCVAATGTNNLDKDYLDKRGIEWRNAAGYSTTIVAQHTFAQILLHTFAQHGPVSLLSLPGQGHHQALQGFHEYAPLLLLYQLPFLLHSLITLNLLSK